MAEISEFQLWPKIPLKLVIFPILKKLWDLKKVFSNLELEGQGRGIIMGLTLLLLLGSFYYIVTYWGDRIMTNTVAAVYLMHDKA